VPAPEPAQDRRFDLAAALLIGALTLFRFCYAGTHELVQDEAYYWQWSRHLAWGYYDNTPLIAPVIRLCTRILGVDEAGVRAGAILSAATATGFIYAIARRLFGAKPAFVSVVVASAMPLFAAGSIIMTQDPLQLACWAPCLYVLWVASEKGGLHRWILAGVLAGLATMAKLNGLLLLPSTLLFLALAPSRRYWLRRPEPYAAAFVAFAIFIPFLIWNHTHQNAFWIHIGVMGSRSSSHDGLKWLGRYLGDQAVLLSPLLFLVFLAALIGGVRRGTREGDERVLFIWAPAATVFVVFLLESLRSKVEGNWPAAAYVSGAILIALELDRMWAASRGRRAFAGAAFGLSLFLSGVAYFPNAVYGAGLGLHLLVPREGTLWSRLPDLRHGGWRERPVDATKDRTNELYGWDTLARRLEQERQAMGDNPFIFGINYRMPSEAAFYLPDHPATYSLFLGDRANEYMFWEDERRLIGQDAICIHDSENPDHIDDARAVFRRVVVEPPLQVFRWPYGRAPIRTIQVYRCYGFKGYDVRRWQHGW
jgi:hypothetical protein